MKGESPRPAISANSNLQLQANPGPQIIRVPIASLLIDSNIPLAYTAATGRPFPTGLNCQVVDFGTFGLRGESVQEYASLETTPPPITITAAQGGYLVNNGRHRLCVAIMAGHETIMALCMPALDERPRGAQLGTRYRSNNAGDGPGKGGFPPGNKTVRSNRSKASRICYNCKKPGHIATACPTPSAKAKRVANSKKLKPYQGLPAAEAAERADKEEGKDVKAEDGDHPDFGGEGGANNRELDAKPAPLAEEREKTPAEWVEEIRNKMFDIASSKFLTKNISDFKDWKVVATSVTFVAKSEKLGIYLRQSPWVEDGIVHTTPASLANCVTQTALQHAIDIRIRDGKRRTLNPKAFTLEQLLVMAGKLTPPPERTKGKTVSEVIDNLDATAPRSVREMSKSQMLFFHIMVVLRISLVAALEECTKALLYCAVLFVCSVAFEGGMTVAATSLKTINDYRRLTELIVQIAQFIIAPALFAGVEVLNKRTSRHRSFVARLIVHGALLAGGSPTAFSGRSVVFAKLLCMAFHISWNLYCFYGMGSTDMMLDALEMTLLARKSTYRKYYDTCLEHNPIKAVETQDGYTRVQHDECCNPKFGCTRVLGVQGVEVVIHRQCTHNEEISMDGRVGKKLPYHVNPAQMARVKGKWKNTIKNITPILVGKIERVTRPIPYEQWCSTFKPAKRDIFLNLKREGYVVPSLPKARSFLKRELALRKTHGRGIAKEKDPRFIQGCPIELSASVGPYVRKLAKKTRKGLKPTGYTPAEVRSGKQIIYTCGLSNEGIGEALTNSVDCITQMLDNDEQVIFLEDDQSRFDLHLTEGPFKFLKSIYMRLLPRKVARQLKRTDKSKGTSVLGTKYTVPYTMQSGWPDTSLGDTLVNAAMKTEIHGSGGKWISIICGDDSITVTTDKEMARLGGTAGLEAAYAEYGMEVEAKTSLNPLEVEFCSARFMPCGEGFILAPKTGKLIARLLHDMVDRTDKQQLAWVRGITQTLVHLGTNDPLLCALASGLARATGEGEVIKKAWDGYERWSDGTKIASENDILVYYDHNYGLNAKDVTELTQILSGLKLGDDFTDARIVSMAMTDC